MVLNLTYHPLNLGQGFQDYPVPKYITDALASTANSPNCLMNQYTRGFVSDSFYPETMPLSHSLFNFKLIFISSKGHPRLVQALSDIYSKLIGRKIDPLNEILVTSGAYEALYSTIQGYLMKFLICSMQNVSCVYRQKFV